MLNGLWRDLETAIEPACRQFSRSNELRARIEELRVTYRASSVHGAPNFGRESTRLAYGIAYHSPHAYAYLHLLARRGLGDTVFGNIGRPPTVMVLGAGLGAETVAVVRWLESRDLDVLRGARFILVDRADWGATREKVLLPTIGDSLSKNNVDLVQWQADLSTSQGLSLIRQHSGNADIILVPSMLTEMITERCEAPFLKTLVGSMASGSKLVLVDHRQPDFQHVSLQWSHQFETLLRDSHERGGVAIPPPGSWIKRNFLDGANNRIPITSYPFSWSVLRKPTVSSN